MHDFTAGGTMVGLLSAAYFYTYAGLMIPAGVLVDALGVRRVVSAGGAVMGLGALAMAAAPSEPLLFAGRLAVGAGAAVTFVGALKIAAT
jgi:MFS family permease